VIRVSNHGQNVELELPEGDHCHPTFHISKIKQYYFPALDEALGDQK
jgi:hypothetical protein